LHKKKKKKGFKRGFYLKLNNYHPCPNYKKSPFCPFLKVEMTIPFTLHKSTTLGKATTNFTTLA
jgi:hypothetical protein